MEEFYMRKTNSIYNQLNNKKKAFTLIELLIVIAIIGILFIVLVSKVDFATDKAKASGVQTDFRSFQMAFDTVAKENAGFNTFGFDTGDNAGTIPTGYAFINEDAKKATMGDGIRNSYDEGDKNLNGKQDVNGKDGYTGTTEVFTGRKVYTEKWTDVWTLVKPGTTGYDADAIFALESAINKNLDPKLHITIATDGKITMANQARDPWKNEYHGYYITNAETDKGDRGAIVMYSNGANGKWGSAHVIENGVVTVTVPGNNVNGKDDYSFVSCYTFVNGYGEVLNATTGFSSNQSFKSNGTGGLAAVVPGGSQSGNADTYQMLDGKNQTFASASPVDLTFRSEGDFDKFVDVKVDGNIVGQSNYTVSEGSTIITLKKEYLQTLSDNVHTIEILSTDGKATTTFTKVGKLDYNTSFELDELMNDEYILLDGSGTIVQIVNGGVYMNGQPAIPAECVTIDGNAMYISGTGEFDGEFVFCEDGYLECYGDIVAKSVKSWVNLDAGLYFIVHNDDIYISEDGNYLIEKYIYMPGIQSAIESYVYAYGGIDAWYSTYGYKFSPFFTNTTVGHVFDMFAFQNIMEHGETHFGIYTGRYNYYGGAAYDVKTEDSLICNANYNETDLDCIVTKQVYAITNNGRKLLNCNDLITNGIYTATEDIRYYKDGKETNNVIFFEDYALYFEDGMTYREWISKYFLMEFNDLCNGYCGGMPCEHNGLYIPEKYLDNLCQPGYRFELEQPIGRIYNDYFGYYYTYNGVTHWQPELIFYSYNRTYIRTTNFNETGYQYLGMAWEGGLQTDGTILAHDYYNYFIRNGLTPKPVPFYSAFKKAEGITEVDISSYLSIVNGKLIVNVDGIVEKYKITNDISVIPVYKQNEYYVDCRNVEVVYENGTNNYYTVQENLGTGEFTGNATGITFYYNGVVYTGFAN